MNNENVGHNFVYNKNGTGSNFQSSAGTLWSYGSVLAKKKDEHIFISDIISNYSPTSNRHALWLNRAIGWNTYARNNTIDIYDDIQAITHHLKEYKTKALYVEMSIAITDIKNMLLKQKKARTRSYFDAIESRINNTQKLIDYIGIDKRTSIYKTWLEYSNIESLKENYIEIINNYEKIKQKELKKEIENKHKRRLKIVSQKTGHNMKEYTKKELSQYDFLYIKDEKLCTTQNLCVDLTYSKLLYRLLKKGENVKGLKIDYYTIISHNDYSIKIGCHNILIKELERVLNV